MIVELKERDSRHTDLTVGQRYLVIGIEADDYRQPASRGHRGLSGLK